MPDRLYAPSGRKIGSRYGFIPIPENNGAEWDDLEAVAMDDNMWLGAPIQDVADLTQTDGAPLFPPPSAG